MSNTFSFLRSITIFDPVRSGCFMHSDFDSAEIFEYQCDYCKTMYKYKPKNKLNQECNCYNCGGLIVKKN